MDIIGVDDLVRIVAQAGGGPDWQQTWPFGPGYSEGFLSTILKFGLIALILGAIALLLRYLFGPGGWLRDKEFDVPPPAGQSPGTAPPDASRREPDRPTHPPDAPHA